MKKLILYAALLSIGLTSVPATAEISIGADVVSRYVWRGTDFGDGVSIQPGISYAAGAVEIGAWSSWGLTSNGANENDLYVSYSAGPVSVTVTSYFFPGTNSSEAVGAVEDDPTTEEDETAPGKEAVPVDFFNVDDHIIELTVGFEAGSLSLLGAVNVMGADTDVYLEAGMDLGSVGDAEVGLAVGIGNKVYTSDGDPMLCNIALNVSQGDYFGSYVINPDTKTPYLFIGKSF